MTTAIREYGPSCCASGIRGYGNPTEGVMLLGIAPGRNEMKGGRPFVGESGRLLDAILMAVGWSRDQVYTTNLICTWNDAPTPLELATCRPRLVTELTQYQPRLIVSLGKIATEEIFRSVFPKKAFGTLQGGVYWVENVLGSGHDCYVLPTFHPAAILHGVTNFVHPIYRDLSKIKDAVHRDRPLCTALDFAVVESTEEAQSVFDHLPNDTYVAVDIESAQGKDADEMLDIFNDTLLCIGLSDGEHTWVIPASCAQGLHWPQDVQWTFHNGNFDVQGISRFLGVKLPIVHDTLLMSYNLDERSGVHGLKFLAREYLAVGFYEDEAHSQAKRGGGYEFIDKAVLYEYNARDAAYTARLAPLLYEWMAKDNVLWPYHHLMIPAANVFADAQLRGIRVDVKKLNELELRWYQQWLDDGDKLKALGEQCGAPVPFNPNSDKQVKHLVFDILGLVPPLEKRSPKTGALSFDKEVRAEMLGMHPFVDALDAFAKLEQIVTNYLLVIRDHIKLDGNLHATTKQHGTVTARTSYTNPPLQTIPNPKYERNAAYAELRQIFVPSDDEHVIAEADYSKAELYCAVSYSSDQAMLADLQSGDFHSRVASEIFRKPLEDVTAQDRTDSKHCSFGIAYGRGARALAKAELKCSVYEAETFIARWKGKYHVYAGWMEQMRKKARAEGELVSLTGRKRRFKLILEQDFKLLNEAINAPVQNLASDSTLMAMIKLHSQLRAYDSSVLLMVHDSLVFDVAKRYLEEVLCIIKRTMEEPQFEGALPIEVEISVGPSWGETKKVEVREVVLA